MSYLLALLGPRDMSDLSPQSGAKADIEHVITSCDSMSTRPSTTGNTSIEQRVDLVLRGVAQLALEARPVEELHVAIALGHRARRDVLERFDAAPDLHHPDD